MVASLLTAIEQTDKALENLRDDATLIEEKYDPVKEARRLYNNWRDSHDGQIAKEAFYKKQKGQCANFKCQLEGQLLPINYFEIDHKLPITKRPDLALDKSNMHLLCSYCNNKKSIKNWSNFMDE